MNNGEQMVKVEISPLTDEPTDASVAHILPTIEFREGVSECYLQDSLSFVKWSSVKGSPIKFSIKPGVKSLSLNDDSIWMSTVFLADKLLLPIVLNQISSYIFYKLGSKDRSENANLHLQVKVRSRNKEKVISVKYEGPASQVGVIIDKVNENDD